MTNSKQNRSCQPATFIQDNKQFSTSSFITIEFGGYFNCRQTTDPDPTDDPYGTSGYTVAMTGEPLLDQIIRLQWQEGKSHLRPNGVLDLRRKVLQGVRVLNVTRNGEDDKLLSDQLCGATVNLAKDWLNDASGEAKERSPMFISNNNVVGSDDTMAFVIEPFNLEITQQLNTGETLQIQGIDALSTSHPNQSAIEFDMPAAYARRLSYKLQTDSAVSHQAIGVFDEYGYFRDRRQWLNQQITLLESLASKIDEFARALKAGELANDTVKWVISVLKSEEILEQLKIHQQGCLVLVDVEAWLALEAQLDERLSTLSIFVEQEIQNCRTRLFQLETWGDRVINKLGFQSFWKHDINCVRECKIDNTAATQAQMEQYLGGEIISDQPWLADYWFGGWDGDLLIGYMAGTLQIPFKPTN